MKKENSEYTFTFDWSYSSIMKIRCCGLDFKKMNKKG